MVKQDQDPVSHPQYSSNPISSTAGSSAKIGPFSSFSSINYRWFWLSGFAAGFTMQMRQISRGWLVYRMSQSPLALAFTMASFGVPILSNVSAPARAATTLWIRQDFFRQILCLIPFYFLVEGSVLASVKLPTFSAFLCF